MAVGIEGGASNVADESLLRLGVSVDFTYRRFNGLEPSGCSITFGLMFVR